MKFGKVQQYPIMESAEKAAVSFMRKRSLAFRIAAAALAGVLLVSSGSASVIEANAEAGPTTGGVVGSEYSTTSKEPKQVDIPTPSASEVVIPFDPNKDLNVNDIEFIYDLPELCDGEVSIKTKNKFFRDSANIYLRYTKDAKKVAANAVNYLYEADLIYYPFEMKVCTVDTGERMILRKNGYIKFEMPVPEDMRTYADSIKLYRIDAGVIKRVKCEVSNDNTVQPMVSFKVSDVSPTYYFFTAVED